MDTMMFMFYLNILCCIYQRLFSLALAARSEGKVYHFRIQRSSIGAYFVSDKISFGTLGELISYYQKNPRCLGLLLVEPCAQQVGTTQNTQTKCS